MDISVIFITRNRKYELLKAIQSCLQSGFNDYEIVIIDNQSSDQTQEVIEPFLVENKIKHTYCYSYKNLGVAQGRNKAFSLSNGRYVVSLDDDAIIQTDDFFNKVLIKMDTNPKIVAAACQIYEPCSKRYLKAKTYYSKQDGIHEVRSFSYQGGAHILRRDFYANKLLYPRKLVFGAEELYPSFLAYKSKKIIAYFDDLVVLHFPSPINRIAGKERTLNNLLNSHIIKKLCYPAMVIPLLKLTFLLRIIKHKIYEYVSFKDIRNLHNQRYDLDEINRMSMIRFLELIKDVGIRSVI